MRVYRPRFFPFLLQGARLRHRQGIEPGKTLLSLFPDSPADQKKMAPLLIFAI
jgi:hypothetical protein